MKLTGDCPNCKKPVAFDIDKLTIKEPKSEIENPEASGQTTTQIQKEPDVTEKIVEKIRAPKDQPFYKCKNCGDAHKNTNYTQKPTKKCQNCGTLNGDPTCKNCGNTNSEEFEELDKEELDELGIPEPNEQNHNHEEE